MQPGIVFGPGPSLILKLSLSRQLTSDLFLILN
jgi:hypothetical protein